jgi:hypothetical protein
LEAAETVNQGSISTYRFSSAQFKSDELKLQPEISLLNKSIVIRVRQKITETLGKNSYVRKEKLFGETRVFVRDILQMAAEI